MCEAGVLLMMQVMEEESAGLRESAPSPMQIVRQAAGERSAVIA
jgi:hypothetical protein